MITQNPKDKKEYGFYEKPDSVIELETLPAGRYKLLILESIMGVRVIFERREQFEKIVEPLASKEYKNIKKSIETFFNPKLRELYSDLKYLNKKGILIHGKPGTGKTASVSYLAEKLANENDSIILEIVDKMHLIIYQELLMILEEIVKIKMYQSCLLLMNVKIILLIRIQKMYYLIF